jgi:hypothetical protein
LNSFFGQREYFSIPIHLLLIGTTTTKEKRKKNPTKNTNNGVSVSGGTVEGRRIP